MTSLGRKLVVASGNRHKVDELRAMLAKVRPELQVRGLDAYPSAPAIEETASTFAGNAVLKAAGIAQWLRSLGEPSDTVVLADDSGICVDALDGAPGVRSARFAGPSASDEDNNGRLVADLRARGLDESSAHYRCVLALVRVDGQPVGHSSAGTSAHGGAALFEGRFDVLVRVARRGDGGFGYDPHAWLPGEDRTVAELERDHKAELSHRGRAMRALLDWLQKD